LKASHAELLGAVGTAEYVGLSLHAVPDDGNAAALASRRKSLNGTLEAVEDVTLSVPVYLKCFVVVVSAYLTLGHGRRGNGESS
jgi:hypothetical protein